MDITIKFNVYDNYFSWEWNGIKIAQIQSTKGDTGAAYYIILPFKYEGPRKGYFKGKMFPQGLQEYDVVKVGSLVDTIRLSHYTYLPANIRGEIMKRVFSDSYLTIGTVSLHGMNALLYPALLFEGFHFALNLGASSLQMKAIPLTYFPKNPTPFTPDRIAIQCKIKEPHLSPYIFRLILRKGPEVFIIIVDVNLDKELVMDGVGIHCCH